MNDANKTKAKLIEELAILRKRVAELEAEKQFSPAVVYTCQISDQRFIPVSVSDNIKERFGYEKWEYLEQPDWWTVHLHPDDLKRVTAGFSLLFKQDRHIHEYRFQHKDGSYRWIHDELTLVRDRDNRPVAIVGAWLDITERKQAEEQLKTTLQEKEALLKEIHHRIYNSFQTITSLLDLQSKQVEDPRILREFQNFKNRVNAMVALYQKLSHSPNVARIDVSGYVRSLISDLRQVYNKQSNAISLKFFFDDMILDMDTAILCGLIINELVSNTMQYAFPTDKEGEIHIDFHLAEKNKVFLSIRDNGVGFPKDVDFRNSESLGLRLVTTLVKQLKGTIQLNSRDGTEFEVYFGI